DGEPGELGKRVAAAGIDVQRGFTVYEAIPGSGKGCITGAILQQIDSHGNLVDDTQLRLACDGIIMIVGWTPSASLLYQPGPRFRYASHVEQFVPVSLRDSVSAAGRVNGVFTLDDQIADGQRAGLQAARFLGRYDGAIPAPPVHTGHPPSHPYPIFPHKKKK